MHVQELVGYTHIKGVFKLVKVLNQYILPNSELYNTPRAILFEFKTNKQMVKDSTKFIFLITYLHVGPQQTCPQNQFKSY